MRFGNDDNHWEGLVLGVAGGVAGVLAMNGFWKLAGKPSGDPIVEGDSALDDISLVGRQREEDESAPQAAGRVVYEQVTGEAPGEETSMLLANLVHWGQGLTMAAGYGALRADRPRLDIVGGLLFGAGLWLVADELLVPLLGLAEGPTKHSADAHVKSLGAHLVYGLATAAATQALRRVA
jgi:hypothetical protein